MQEPYLTIRPSDSCIACGPDSSLLINIAKRLTKTKLKVKLEVQPLPFSRTSRREQCPSPRSSFPLCGFFGHLLELSCLPRTMVRVVERGKRKRRVCSALFKYLYRGRQAIRSNLIREALMIGGK